MKAIIALSIVALFAGCLGEGATIKGAIETAYDFEQYHFADPIYHDAAGNIMPLPDGLAPTVVQLLMPEGAYEAIQRNTFAPTAAVSKKGVMLAASSDALIGSADGAHWSVVRSLNSPEFPTKLDRFENAGNAIWADAKTGRLFLTHILQNPNFRCQAIMYSDDDGQTWRDSVTNMWPTSCADNRHPILSFVPRIFSAPHGPSAIIGAVGPGAVYYCDAHVAYGPKCSVSLDGGDVFAYDSLPAPHDINCWRSNIGRPGIHTDGTVLLPLGTDSKLQSLVGLGVCDAPPRVSVTADDGRTWQVRSLPNASFHNTEAAPSIAVDGKGVAYMSFRGPDQLVYLVRSKDKFTTWEGPWRVSPPGHTMAFYNTVSVGDDGRVMVSYFGTTTAQEEGAKPTPLNAEPGTEWHLFVTNSHDALADAPTFITTQVTPMEDPVGMGVIFPREAANTGMFIDSAVTADGRYFVTFMDGCTARNGCLTDTEGAFDGNDHEVAVAILDEGASLFAAKGTLPSLGLEHPTPVT